MPWSTRCRASSLWLIAIAMGLFSDTLGRRVSRSHWRSRRAAPRKWKRVNEIRLGEQADGARSPLRLYNEDYAVLAIIDPVGLVPAQPIGRAVLPAWAPAPLTPRFPGARPRAQIWRDVLETRTVAGARRLEFHSALSSPSSSLVSSSVAAGRISASCSGWRALAIGAATPGCTLTQASATAATEVP
jgi:hypothetical protein